MKKTKNIIPKEGRLRSSWEETAMILAKTIARERSQDPYVQVGACAIKFDNTFVLGYNGSAPKIEIDWSNRNKRRRYVLHAESNVLDLCKPKEINILAVTHLPCPECLKRIAKYDPKKVIYSSCEYSTVKIKKSMDMAKTLKINLIWHP